MRNVTSGTVYLFPRGRRAPRTIALAGLGLLILILPLLAACGGATSGKSNTTGTPLPRATGVFMTTLNTADTQRTGIEAVTIAALDIDTGHSRWRYQTQWAAFHLASAPVVADGLVFATSDENVATATSANPPTGSLIALRATDGSPAWKATIGAFAASPVVDGTTIYVSADDFASQTMDVLALQASTGNILWRARLGRDMTTGLYSALTLANGTLYLTSNELCFDYCTAGYLIALRARDGAVLWHTSVAGGPSLNIRPAAVLDGKVITSVKDYVANPSDNSTSPEAEMVAYDAASGKSLWRLATNLQELGPQQDGIAPTVADGLVFITAGNAVPPSEVDSQQYALWALDASTGTVRWRIEAGPGKALVVDGVDNSVVLAQRVTRSALADNTLLGLAAGDGHQLWSANAGAQLSGIQIAGGVLYGESAAEFSHNGKPSPPATVVAVHVSDGAVLWHASVTAAVSPQFPIFHRPLVATTHAILVAPGDYLLAALDPATGHLLWQMPTQDQIAGVAAA